MKYVKPAAIEVTLFLLALLLLSSFVWYPRQPAVSLNPAHDPILSDVAETTDSLAIYAKWAATVPAEAKLDYAYAYPWLVKDEEAKTRPYSDALPLLYAQQYGDWPPAQPEQATRLDLMYAQQYGDWPQAR
ncbi:MAG TPA: hypothetical protein PLD25_10120 [Chloroflexota bacterium]|nr:hypothetical protein [Chloroflexota bacterium]HUM68177.1 hypothetical protein [Chloroflexota bacterium]